MEEGTSKENKDSTDKKGGQSLPAGKAGKIPAIRTLKSDSQAYLDREKLSTVDLAVKKAKVSGIKYKTKRRAEHSSRGPIVAVSVFLLISILVFATVAAVNLLSVPKSPEGQFILPDSLIKVENREEIVLNRKSANQIKESVRSRVSSLPLGEAVDFIPSFEERSTEDPEVKTKREVGSKEFLSFIDVRPPSRVRSFLEDRFMFGFYTGTVDSPFIMFKITSYDHAFAGMLEWEDTIVSDLRNIFTLGSISPNLFFKDIVINNRDARILLGQSGETILLYSFLDANTLLIATNSQTFNEVARRFALPR